MQVYHGDLKPENILLTSNLSVYIADFATYKPAYIHVNDLASYTYYFGSYNTDNMKGCYLAPERLSDTKDIDENLDKNSSMDVFSLGLIIAELFLEKVIFDFTSLRNYKKGEISKKQLEDLLKDIKNIKIKNLILDMIKINPEERIIIDAALKRFTEEVCPITMTGFLFHLNIIINKTEFWKPDFLIGFLYRYWETIWKMIYGPSSTPGQLFQRMNFPIINKLIADNPISYNLRYSLFKKDKKGIFSIDEYNLLFAPSDGKINFEYTDESIFKKNNNEDCVFIIINLLIQNFQNVKYETSNYVAMEMLKNFCVKLPDIIKLQLIIPYLVNNIKRTRYTTKLTSLNYIFEILYSFNYNDLLLPVTEYNYFDSYIFPKILKFYEPKKPYLVLEFLNNIDRIIDLEMKFLNITLKSRIKRMNEIIKEEKNIAPKNNKDKIDDKDEKYKEIIKKRNKRTEEIYNDYDNCLESFKNNLLNVIMDVIGSINEIDLLIITIRKLPCIIDFFGQSKSNEFSKFIINNFNN
jgi:phosphoinositide-3-kinase regulatory subunit 4